MLMLHVGDARFALEGNRFDFKSVQFAVKESDLT